MNATAVPSLFTARRTRPHGTGKEQAVVRVGDEREALIEPAVCERVRKRRDGPIGRFRPVIVVDRAEMVLDLLSEKLEGTVDTRGERFYLVGKTGRHEMHMVAEGWRKFALLYLLTANGSLGRGSVLYWDEPETNLNPSIMDELIHVLFALSRFGVQVFLATRDYIIPKELDLQRTEADLPRFFAMERKVDALRQPDIHCLRRR